MEPINEGDGIVKITKKRCSDEPIDGNKPNKVRWQWNHQIGKKSVMVTSLNPKPQESKYHTIDHVTCKFLILFMKYDVTCFQLG